MTGAIPSGQHGRNGGTPFWPELFWRRVRAGWIFLAIFCATIMPAAAHLPAVAAALATIQPDGKCTVELTFDVPPFVLNTPPQDATDDAMNAWLDGPTNALAASLAAARGRFAGEFAVVTDQGAASVEKIIFPSAADLERYKESVPMIRLPLMLMLLETGKLPAGTRSVSFRFPAVMGIVAVTVNRPGQPAVALVANAGAVSEAVPVRLAEAESTAAANPLAEPGRWSVARQYLVLGFNHIIPEGTDHILFVLGLFLLSCRVKPLLWQVTAFTVAHSITLGLAMYGVFRLPSAVVEPMIAASIAFVAVENICTPELKPWRPVVVFCFGLIHGLGFSSVLLELGLPRQDFATALVSFNGGVELGQLTVISAAFLAVGWWRGRTWYRQRIVIPASALIAATGIFWTVQRIWLATR